MVYKIIFLKIPFALSKFPGSFYPPAVWRAIGRAAENEQKYGNYRHIHKSVAI